MPLYINKAHGKKIGPYFRKAISQIHTQGRGAEFDPMMALNILTKLMNTMVVNVMQGKLHGNRIFHYCHHSHCKASIKSLEGYSAFHRLLIKLVSEFPSVLNSANETIAKFIKSEKNRSKSSISALGEFLPLLTIA